MRLIHQSQLTIKKPKYSIPEIERRWLAIEANLPDLSSLVPWEITDRYIAGTRLRLRRMAKIEDTEDNNHVIFKLCKKYGKTSSISEPIVNIYLTATEYNTLVQLPATQTKKLRYDVDYSSVHFMVNFYLDDGPITVEAEFESESDAEKCQIPPFCGQEVSNDKSFEGKSLATNPGGP